MAASPKSILDLSAGGLKKLEKRDGVGVKHLILDNNELSKLENMDCFPDLEKLSASGNSIIRMFPVSKCHYLVNINLSNNGIVCIEGIKDLHNLAFLNLSVNRIKVIQNFVHTENLTHLDFSKNDISRLDSLSCLSKLKNLHLSGNKITSLEKASQHLPHSLCVLSLADNNIADLNEVSHLVGLESLEQLTISGNACVTANEQLGLPPFDYRPFVINWCLGLRLLDGYVATQKESLKAEWLYSQGKGRHFKSGEHAELVEYLAQSCPLNTDKLVEEEDEKLSRILHMQRQHKEQFLSEMSQSVHPDQVNQVKRKMLRMTNSYHANDSEQSQTSTTHSNNGTSRIMYESAPEVLFNSSEPMQNTVPSSTEGSPHLLSKSEMLHSSARSPITIEQVSVDSEKPKSSSIAKTPHQYCEERRLRPASAEVNVVQNKGPLVRKVSRRSTSPNVSCSTPGRPKVPISYRSKISPSRSCILNAKLSISKNSSESESSEELSHSSKILHQNTRRAVKSYTPQSSSPVFRQKLNSEPAPTKEDLTKGVSNSFSGLDETFIIKNYPVVTMSQKYRISEDKLSNAAIKIQSAWRGYRVRHCNPKVLNLRQEIRFRRMEDHIQHLHGHMCRLTDFVLRQQKDLQHERELRKLQAEDIRNLHEKAKELEKDVSLIVMRSKQNEFQKVSEHYSYDIQNLAFSRKCVSKDNRCLPSFEPGRLLQDISPDSPSSVQYSAQTFAENSGLFSPSSQTSSVGHDGTLSQSLSHHYLQPSTSDLSDADSGLQSMVSPNLNAFLEAEKNLCSEGIPNSISDNYGLAAIGSIRTQHHKQLSKCISDNQDKNVPEMNVRNLKVKPIDSPFTLGENRCSQSVSISRESVPNGLNGTCNENISEINLNAMASSSHLFRQGPSSSNIYQQIASDNFKTQSFYRNIGDSDPQRDFDSFECCESFPLKKDVSLSPIFPYPPAQCLSNNLELVTQELSKQHFQDSKVDCNEASTDAKEVQDNPCSHNHNSALHDKTKRFNDPIASSLSVFAKDSIVPVSCSLGEKSKTINVSKTRPSVFNKSLVQGIISNTSTPLEDCKSPQSPCTVEMSGRISHSCSFQSDGFTTAEELSATTTVKLFSARTMSMACGSNPQSPQTAIQRPLSLSDATSQGSIRSPLVLASHMWEKKVQDIESTFQHLQAQIRELEGAFGQVGQLSQFLYPGILSDDPKDARHLIHCLDSGSGSLVLDMPKLNFKCGNNGNSGDLFLQTHFAHHGANGVPFLSPSNCLPQTSAQNSDYCRVEELEQESQSMNKKCLKLPLHDKTGNDPKQ